MPFAGFKDFADCIRQQMAKTSKRTGKKFTKDAASRVCAVIQRRAEKEQLEITNSFIKIEESEWEKIDKGVIKETIRYHFDREVFDISDAIQYLEKKLSYKQRKALPSSAFVFPKQKRYPIHDRAHAQNALARVSQKGTPSEKAKVRAAVCRKYPDFPACKKGKK